MLKGNRAGNSARFANRCSSTKRTSRSFRLQRTGENKFYRQGIANQQELVGGFPKTEEELFAYQGLILGSVEASFFTADQLRNIEAFVSRRGGGLLALGGRLAFDGGKYKGTPVADLLPLTLEGRTTDVAE